MDEKTTAILRDNHGYTAQAAREAAEKGQLEHWVLAYLGTGYWANQPMVEGLQKSPRWWNGPIKLPIRMLNRTLGPEAGKKFEVAQAYWTERTQAMAAAFESIETYPPLIAEYTATGLLVADGNTRLGTFEMLDVPACWVIIWYNAQLDYELHTHSLKEVGWLN